MVKIRQLLEHSYERDIRAPEQALSKKRRYIQTADMAFIKIKGRMLLSILSANRDFLCRRPIFDAPDIEGHITYLASFAVSAYRPRSVPAPLITAAADDELLYYVDGDARKKCCGE